MCIRDRFRTQRDVDAGARVVAAFHAVPGHEVVTVPTQQMVGPFRRARPIHLSALRSIIDAETIAVPPTLAASVEVVTDLGAVDIVVPDGGPVADHIRTVSYTHLTLPTSDLV